MTNQDSVLKSRDITLPTKVCIVKAMVFQQSCKMWELGHKEYWAPKNLCFWTVVLENTLESPFDCKEIKPEYSLEGLMLELKLQNLGYLRPRAGSLEKTLMLEKIGGKRRRWQRMRRLDGITDSMDMSLNKLQKIVKSREACRTAVHGVAKSWTRDWDWATKNKILHCGTILTPIAPPLHILHSRYMVSLSVQLHRVLPTLFPYLKPSNASFPGISQSLHTGLTNTRCRFKGEFQRNCE